MFTQDAIQPNATTMSSKKTGSGVILYVGNNAALFASAFAQHGVEMQVADNALAAIQLIASDKKPAAIVCEYHLPGNTGLLLFDNIRTNASFDHIPFVLLSTQFSSDLFKLAVQKKVDDFFVLSSVSPSNLAERIAYLQQYRKKTNQQPYKQPESTLQLPLSKRAFDIAVAGTALLLLSPILLLVIIAIRMESKGKVYYISKRVGRKVFDFYKLRSMRSGADLELTKLAKEKNQYNTTTSNQEIRFDLPCPRCTRLSQTSTCSPVIFIDKHNICEYWYTTQKNNIAKNKAAFVKIADDPRITRVGKFIRNTSIDELPQLINVIKGDMSIVGNRPLPVYEAEMLTSDMLAKRFLAPAGITGLWQVELRGKGGDMSEAERIQLDNLYADHFSNGTYSFWYDMKLILRTIPALFQKSTV